MLYSSDGRFGVEKALGAFLKQNYVSTTRNVRNAFGRLPGAMFNIFTPILGGIPETRPMAFIAGGPMEA